MNLQNLNVAELSAQEVRETEGGGWGAVLKEIAKQVGVGLIVDYIKEEIEEGWNSVEPCC